MTAIIKQDVLAFAPSLSTVNDVAWAMILQFVNTLKADNLWPDEGEDGPSLRLARILLAAHYGDVTRRGKSGAAGPVTSEAAGAVRRSYGLVALASSDAALGSTVFGQQYMGLLAMSGTVHGPQLI